MLKFAPIMPAFCLLLLYSYYANNFAGEIDGSLLLRPAKYAVLMDYIGSSKINSLLYIVHSYSICNDSLREILKFLIMKCIDNLKSQPQNFPTVCYLQCLYEFIK